uniref:Uncharacterized protein n=1 Tax=Panagrolaimus superbus TaxID=310955 RepID=A0A914YKF9_9BILA
MESIWEGGQAFVAFSRVETIDGLYLADYHPLKIRVDKSCLVEYNRLRESIGLTKFPIPSGKTINKGPEPVNIASQRRFRKRSSLATNVIIPTKIARIENDNENVVMVEEDGDNFDIVYRDVNGEALRQFNSTRC